MLKIKVKTANSKNPNAFKAVEIKDMIQEKRFGHRTVTDLERKRPRNMNEKRQLKQWEKNVAVKDRINLINLNCETLSHLDWAFFTIKNLSFLLQQRQRLSWYIIFGSFIHPISYIYPVL